MLTNIMYKKLTKNVILIQFENNIFLQ